MLANCAGGSVPSAKPTHRTNRKPTMRKIILMAIATFAWKKWQARTRPGAVPTGRVQPGNPTPPL
jgi:hypothetical protein